MAFRRIALLFAVAALAPGLARAAQGAPPSASNRVGVLVGIEDEDGPAGLQLRGDLEFSQQRLSPAVTLSIVGSLGYSYFHDDYTDFFLTEKWESSTHVLRFAPAARFSFGSSPVFRPYLDGSLGLYWASTSVEITDLTFGVRQSVFFLYDRLPRLGQFGIELGKVLLVRGNVILRVNGLHWALSHA